MYRHQDISALNDPADYEKGADVAGIATWIPDLHLASWMWDAFGWSTFAAAHPDMKAEEIASAAADGFEVR